MYGALCTYPTLMGRVNLGWVRNALGSARTDDYVARCTPLPGRRGTCTRKWAVAPAGVQIGGEPGYNCRLAWSVVYGGSKETLGQDHFFRKCLVISRVVRPGRFVFHL